MVSTKARALIQQSPLSQAQFPRNFRASHVCIRQFATSSADSDVTTLRQFAEDNRISLAAAKRLLRRAKVNVTKVDNQTQIFLRKVAEEKIATYMENCVANRKRGAKKAAMTRKNNKLHKKLEAKWTANARQKGVSLEAYSGTILKKVAWKHIPTTESGEQQQTPSTLQGVFTFAKAIKGSGSFQMYEQLLSLEYSETLNTQESVVEVDLTDNSTNSSGKSSFEASPKSGTKDLASRSKTDTK